MIKLLYNYLLSFIYTLYYYFKFPNISLILPDLATIPIVKFFNKKNLIDSLVITTSSIYSQPLWMRNFDEKKFKTHFLNYSDNSEKFIYKECPLFHDFPAIRHISVDKQWVWTENQKKMYFNSGHKGSINLVDPITFSNQSKIFKKNSDAFKIVVFDIYPFLLSKIKNIGGVKYYYKTKLVLNFIKDIILSCEEISKKSGIKIQIFLKSKRNIYRGFHDPMYLSELKNLNLKHKSFNIAPYDENIYDFIKNSNLSISIPYTSTAHVASYLKIKSIYYDPSEQLVREISDKIIFINNKDKLTKEINKHLKICK